MAWNASLPDGGRPLREGDDAIRANWAYLQTTLGAFIDAFAGSGDTGRLKAAIWNGVGARPASPKVGFFGFRADIQAIEFWTGTVWSTLHALPVGAIVEWTGSVATLPLGWRGCWTGAGGAAGTTVNTIVIPDLGARFPVGYAPGDADYDAIGAGASTAKGFKVTEDNIEQFDSGAGSPHSHGYAAPIAPGGIAAGASYGANAAVTDPESAHTHPIGKVGADEIDKRPPFYVVGKIVYVGVA
jgi:hypothetical protein